MTPGEWTPFIAVATGFVSVVGSILAWWVKLRWSKEFAAAKDEVIRAKEAQIDVLRQQLESMKLLTSAAIVEHLRTMKQGLEDVIAGLRAQLATAALEGDARNLKIQELEAQGATQLEVQRLAAENLELETRAAALEHRLQDVARRPDSLLLPEVYEAVLLSSSALSNSLTTSPTYRMPQHPVMSEYRELRELTEKISEFQRAFDPLLRKAVGFGTLINPDKESKE